MGVSGVVYLSVPAIQHLISFCRNVLRLVDRFDLLSRDSRYPGVIGLLLRRQFNSGPAQTIVLGQT
jgi:hypothetical protein